MKSPPLVSCRTAKRTCWALRALGLAAIFSTGCSAELSNPSFPTKLETARDDLDRMRQDPRKLDRPLVVIGGAMDPGVAAWWLRSKFAALTGDDRIICVSLGSCASLDACREKIVKAVETAFPGDSTSHTTEVDVVGYSLGGLAARYAADSSGPVKRLAIHRLFAISSPLQGAKVAQRLPLLHPVQADVRPGSALLTQLNSHDPAYPVYAYIRLGDSTIGEANAALPGQTAWWVDVAPLSDAHNGAFYDARFIADIARRLRDEPAYSRFPPALLPQPVTPHG